MPCRIIQGDCRDVLPTLPAESVHCVVTSPPYWGLRDYGVAGQIGLESDFNAYVAEMVAVFHEVRRVLRADGTLWLNLGDCYATGAGRVGQHPGGGEQGARWRGGPPSDKSTLRGNGHVGGGPKLRALDPVPANRGVHTAEHIDAMGPMTQPNRMPQAGLKPKDLVGVPWRVAFALQADGWYLRQDIIWAKPNPMPESVRDRCTKAHEYLFLLSKSERYYFDADAIREPYSEASLDRYNYEKQGTAPTCLQPNGDVGRRLREKGIQAPNDLGRNRRSVWNISTEPFPEAHFATFPPALIEPCIKAGCPIGGTVLDPFGGAGTTALVADRLQRKSILIELNPDYADMARRRVVGDAPLFAEAAE